MPFEGYSIGDPLVQEATLLFCISKNIKDVIDIVTDHKKARRVSMEKKSSLEKLVKNLIDGKVNLLEIFSAFSDTFNEDEGDIKYTANHILNTVKGDVKEIVEGLKKFHWHSFVGKEFSYIEKKIWSFF